MVIRPLASLNAGGSEAMGGKPLETSRQSAPDAETKTPLSVPSQRTRAPCQARSCTHSSVPASEGVARRFHPRPRASLDHNAFWAIASHALAEAAARNVTACGSPGERDRRNSSASGSFLHKPSSVDTTTPRPFGSNSVTCRGSTRTWRALRGRGPAGARLAPGSSSSKGTPRQVMVETSNLAAPPSAKETHQPSEEPKIFPTVFPRACSASLLHDLPESRVSTSAPAKPSTRASRWVLSPGSAARANSTRCENPAFHEAKLSPASSLPSTPSPATPASTRS